MVGRECLPYPVICPKGEHTVLVNGVFGCTLNNPYPQIPPTPPQCAPGHFDPCVLSLPSGPHTVGFTKGWFDGNTGSGCNNPYSAGSKDYSGYKLGCEQGGAASTPYTNCEHFDTCGDPLFNPTAKNVKCNIGLDCGTPGLNEPLTGPPCTVNDCVSCSKYDQGSHCFPKPNVVQLPEAIPVQQTPTPTTAIDCKTDPSLPSCTQTLTSPSALTKTCPDGSKPDITGKCRVVPQVTPAPNFAQGLTPSCGTAGNPCQSPPPTSTGPPSTSNPNTSSPPLTNSNPTLPPSDNNPNPPSTSNNGGGSSSGGGGSGSSNGGGSGSSNGGGSSPP